MKTKDLDFNLPVDLLAREPREIRGESRDEAHLLVMKRKTAEVEHSRFKLIGNYLAPGDLLVLNDSKTINALLYGWYDGKSRIEVRLCSGKEKDIWHCTLRPSRKVQIGSEISFGDGDVIAKVVDRRKDIPDLWVLQFSYNGDFYEKIEKIGRPVLSPYVSKKWSLDYYQTVYAKKEGSAEMPAAGRHFTPELLATLKERGINHVFITLHTGLSSINISEEYFEQHKMYEEEYEIDESTAEAINTTRENKGRIVAVGTTVTRTLETNADNKGFVEPKRGWTNLYIYPGYKWKIVDILVTNFHGPRTSRIALAVAFTGKDLLMRGYREAIEKGYKFYEFGDTTITV